MNRFQIQDFANEVSNELEKRQRKIIELESNISNLIKRETDRLNEIVRLRCKHIKLQTAVQELDLTGTHQTIVNIRNSL